VEQESRQIYYFYNDNFAETFVDEAGLKGKGLDFKLKTKMAAVYQWYCDHMQGLAREPPVVLLTDSLKSKQEYMGVVKGQFHEGVLTMEEFILMN